MADRNLETRRTSDSELGQMVEILGTSMVKAIPKIILKHPDSDLDALMHLVVQDRDLPVHILTIIRKYIRDIMGDPRIQASLVRGQRTRDSELGQISEILGPSMVKAIPKIILKHPDSDLDALMHLVVQDRDLPVHILAIIRKYIRNIMGDPRIQAAQSRGFADEPIIVEARLVEPDDSDLPILPVLHTTGASKKKKPKSRRKTKKKIRSSKGSKKLKRYKRRPKSHTKRLIKKTKSRKLSKRK